MGLLQASKRKVLSIADENSRLPELGLQVNDYVSPTLEEQYTESEKPTTLMTAYNCKSTQKWRLRNLEDILKSFKSGQLAFVGPVGSGKTTLVKMIAQSVIRKKYESLNDVELVFIIDHSIKENVKVTGRELIFRSLWSGKMERKSRKSVMDYAENNPERVLFVLDGLDTMKLGEVWTSEKVMFDEEAFPDEHLGKFLAGRYLTGCRIITSGRNQILRSFNDKVHPNRVVMLTGFSKPAIEKVIFGYLGASNQAQTIISRLQNEMKPLWSLCSSPAILKYTLCAIDAHDRIISTLTGLLKVILERLKVDGGKEADLNAIKEKLKRLSYDGVKERDIVFSDSHLHKYCLSVEQLTSLSLPCRWGPDVKLIQRTSQCFFTHMSMQEALAALHVAALTKPNYRTFIQHEVNLPQFTLVRRLLHGLLRSKRNQCEIVQVDDKDFKLELLYENDASILQKQLSPGGNSDYHEILQIFYCLYESQDIPRDIQRIIRNIELKNLPISTSDAYIIGWVISCCETIQAISFWNCALNSSVCQTLEETVEDGNVQIGSLNIHENEGLEPKAMTHIGKMAGRCSINGMVFQGCEVSAEHIITLEQNLDKIGNLILWGRTEMGKDFRSAILPLIPKVSTYLALDMWEVSNDDKNAIQEAVDALEHSELKINIYPADKFIERRENKKRSIFKSSDGESQLKRGRLSNKHQETPVVADRMAARIKEKISKFTELPQSKELDLSYLPLSQTNIENVANALINKKTTSCLKLRSCLKREFVQHLQQYATVVLPKPHEIVKVDVSANPEFGADNAKALGILMQLWKTACLDISECDFTYDEVASLHDPTKPLVLTRLLYNNNVVSPQIVTALSNLSAASSIVSLHLGNCGLMEQHLEVLESQVHHTKLETLDLSYNREMGENGYAAVGRAVLKSLISNVLFVDCGTVHPELERFQIGLKGKSLMHLNLSYNDELVNDESKRAVAHTLELILPSTLSLSGCSVDAEMLKDMANSSIGSKLTRLAVRDNPKLGQDSIEVVITIIKNLSLNSLNIDNCGWNQGDILTLPPHIKTIVLNKETEQTGHNSFVLV